MTFTYLQEILYRCCRCQIHRKQAVSVLDKLPLDSGIRAKFESLVNKQGRLLTAAGYLSEELHVLAEVRFQLVDGPNDDSSTSSEIATKNGGFMSLQALNQSLGDDATVHSFRPVSSQLVDFRHPDATPEQVKAAGGPSRQVFTVNKAGALLFTFFTATSPPECIEVDIRQQDIRAITMNKKVG